MSNSASAPFVGLGEGSGRELGKEPGRELGGESPGELGEEPTQELGEELAGELAEESTGELGAELAGELGEELTQELGKGLAGERGEESIEEPEEELTEELREESAQERREELTEEPGEELTRELGEGSTQRRGQLRVIRLNRSLQGQLREYPSLSRVYNIVELIDDGAGARRGRGKGKWRMTGAEERTAKFAKGAKPGFRTANWNWKLVPARRGDGSRFAGPGTRWLRRGFVAGDGRLFMLRDSGHGRIRLDVDPAQPLGHADTFADTLLFLFAAHLVQPVHPVLVSSLHSAAPLRVS